MHKPRFLDQFAMDLGDREAFTVAFARGRRAFQPRTSRRNGRATASPDIRHIKLEVALDFDAKKISGTATHRLAAITGPLDRLEFDAAELESRRSARRRARHVRDLPTASCRIDAAARARAGEEIEVAIDYCGRIRAADSISSVPTTGIRTSRVKRGRRARTRTRATGFPATTTRTIGHQRSDRDGAGEIHRGLQRRADLDHRQCQRARPAPFTGAMRCRTRRI